MDALSALDRNLTTTLVLGTLRWQLALDARIRELLARPDARLSDEAATALRMGAYQLLFLERIPAHAVLHDSVELVKQSKEGAAAGMVNAVLRNIQRAGLQPPAPEAAHPAWMVERWVKRYGLAAAEAICRWDQEPARVTLRVGGAQTEMAGTEPGFFLSSARRVVRREPGENPAPGESPARIQDEASQLVAELLAAQADEAANAEAPLRVLDTCAAPGGKTAILAERLPKAEITAMDVSRKRIEGMRRILPPSITAPLRFEVADAATMDLKPEWDLILCDVPCSGTGTMARNPEIRQRANERDLLRQQARQAAILRAALRGLKPGGRLLYSTCSLEPEENEQVVEGALREASGVRIVPVAPILDRLSQQSVVTPEGRERLRSAIDGDFLRTIPGVHSCDGFFAAVLRKQ